MSNDGCSNPSGGSSGRAIGHLLEPGEAIAAIADFDHACFNRSGAHSLGEFLDEKLGVIVDASFGKVGKNFALGPEAGASYDINLRVTREADIKLDITTYADAGHIDDGDASDGFEIEQIVIDFLEHTRRVEVLPCLRGIFPLGVEKRICSCRLVMPSCRG